MTAIYIPPDATTNSTLGLLHDTVSCQQNMHPFTSWQGIWTMLRSPDYISISNVLQGEKILWTSFILRPCHIWVSHTTCPCSWYQHRPPSGKVPLPHVELIRLGLNMRLGSCRAALRQQTGMCLSIRTWSSTQQCLCVCVHVWYYW